MSRVILRVGRLIDGSGRPPIEDACLEIASGRVSRAGRAAEFGSILDDDVRDLSRLTAMPGLVNAHTHLVSQRLEVPSWQVWQWPETLAILRAAEKGRTELELGVTTVRDLGAKGNLNIVLKRAIEMGIVKGPRLVVAGQLICATGGHGNYMGREVNGPDEMRAAVREMFKRGADVIKVVGSGGMGLTGLHPVFPWETQILAEAVQQELTEAEIRVAVEEAHKIGRRVAAHAYGMTAIGAALRAGVDSLEHGIGLDTPSAEYMAQNSVSYVPTLTGIQQFLEFGPRRGYTGYLLERAERAVVEHQATVARARAAGVRIAAGTDSSGELRLELEHLVAAGMSNAEAIVAVTRAGAEVLGIEDQVGTLTPGKWADVLVVDGNPLDRIGDVRNVRMVLKGGEVVSENPATDPATT